MCACAIITLGAAPAAAYWTGDGIYIGENYGSSEPMIIPDGAGGAIIAWFKDDGGGYTDIYAQRVDAFGTPLWTSGGVAVCTVGGYQLYPRLVSDGAGGAIVTWHDYRDKTTYDIYAQRVDASGATRWTADGVAICTAADNQLYPTIVSDGAGGGIITWYDRRGGANYDVYVQLVDYKGTIKWTANGIAICAAANDQQRPVIVSDGAGGAVIAWMDRRGGVYYDIYAQRVDNDGNIKWTGDGIALCAAFGNQYYPEIDSDGSGGAIDTWYDLRAGGGDDNIYAQRVNTMGDIQWTGDGVAVCMAANGQSDPVIVSDGAGGAVIAWEDDRVAGTNVYAQRLDNPGAVQWTADGVALCTAAANQLKPMIASDGAGGAIVGWYDYRGGNADIYVQRVGAAGAVQWIADGVPLCAAAEDQMHPAIASDGAGGAIAAWQDYRSESTYEVYAQRVKPPGFPGGSWPTIEDVADVPADEGGWVRLHVARSEWDGFYAGTYPITGYNVWRLVSSGASPGVLPPAGEMTSLESRAVESFFAAPESARGLRLSGAAATALGLPPGTWESLGFHAAMQEEHYDFTVPTKTDSTSAGDALETYVVTAHTTVPAAHVASDPDSGHSVDNLAPGTPEGLAAEQSFEPEGLELAWNERGEADLWHYSVYRGTSADFVPSAGNRIGTPTDAGYFDAGWSWDGGYFYKVSAVDRHGNESGFALLAPDGITGTDAPKAPEASYLAQNYPNPFNPTTRVAFGLSAPGHVSLRIYDAAGRLVRALADEDRSAGRYEETWDGRDSNGRAVSSGIYFYRLTAGSFVETRKMALLR